MNQMQLDKEKYGRICVRHELHIDPITVQVRPDRDNSQALHRYYHDAKILAVNERTEFIDVDGGKTLGSAMVREIKYHAYWHVYIVMFDDVQEGEQS